MLSRYIIEMAYKMKIFPPLLSLLPIPPLFSFLSFSSLTILPLSCSPYCFLSVISDTYFIYCILYIYIFFFRSLFFMCFIQLVAHLSNFGNFQFRGMGFDPSYSWATLLTLTIEPPRLLRN